MSLINSIRKRLFDNEIVEIHSQSDTYPADVTEQERLIWESVAPYTMTNVERVLALVNAVRYLSINQVEGAFVECGVWKGGSSMAMLKTLQSYQLEDRELYLYDTFDGMSEPTEYDVSCHGEDAREVLAEQDKNNSKSYWCYSPLDEVKKNIASLLYPSDKVHYIKGKVEETLLVGAPDKISLLRLDTDWYESTKVELEVLWPRLVSGGVLIIDDYGHWQGARRAVDEFIQRQGLQLLLNRIDYTGRIAVKL